MPKEVLEHPHNYCCYAVANQIKGNYTPIPDNVKNGELLEFAKDECEMFSEDSKMGVFFREVVKILEVMTDSVKKNRKMTDKEKQINAQVIDIRSSLNEITKDIESRELYDKLISLDNQIYKIREIIKAEEL